MGVTKFDTVNATGARAKYASSLPSLPEDYFDGGIEDPGSKEWSGGEVVYHSTEHALYVQQNTSGRTPSWRKLAGFATTTSTSTSTSTSSTTSSSTSTSTSTSSSTSTSTSTSTSSSTSTSTSTSSTTTP